MFYFYSLEVERFVLYTTISKDPCQKLKGVGLQKPCDFCLVWSTKCNISASGKSLPISTFLGDNDAYEVGSVHLHWCKDNFD